MAQQIVKKHIFGDMLAIWVGDGERVELQIVPAGMETQIVPPRDNLNDTVACRVLHKVWDINFPGRGVESAIQYKLSSDGYGLISNPGFTMRDSDSVLAQKHYEFTDLPDGVRLSVRDDRGIESTQDVTYRPGDRYVKVTTTIANRGAEAVDLEYLASFSLGGLSPLVSDDGPENYRISQWSTGWSAEGRLVERKLEECGLERSWAGFAPRSLRFGQTGTKPARDFFPQIGFTDVKAGVVWGAVLDVYGPWEMEVSRKLDGVYLSGGLASREVGQWKKTLAPGESFTAPAAVITCVRGDIQDLQNRLVGFAEGEVRENEKELPLLFNDWCTTWGKPYPENLLPIADKLQGLPIRYFVMDDGWFRKDKEYDIGDWQVVEDKYPQGMRKFCDQLRERGFIPGIWFEFENAVFNSRVAKEHPDWLLTLDGKVLRCGTRNFLDFRKKEVIDYVAEKVIKFLKDNRIGYTKIDYNAIIAFGCDGAESVGEALRQHIEGVIAFFHRLLAEIPDLVLEVCASGGSRTTAPWLRLGSMASSSDAHEGVEIPILAANTAALIPLRKNQIWAVLHPEDDDRRFYYSLAAGFMGRLCFSGDIAPLSDHQMEIVRSACALYRQAIPAVEVGDNRYEREIGLAYIDPRGYQVWKRENDRGALVVVHTFRGSPAQLELPIPAAWKLAGQLVGGGVEVSRAADQLTIGNLADFTGLVLWFEK